MPETHVVARGEVTLSFWHGTSWGPLAGAVHYQRVPPMVECNVPDGYWMLLARAEELEGVA